MKRISIVNVYGQSFGADLEDPVQWIAEQELNKSWGLAQRWVAEDQCSAADKASALAQRDVQMLDDSVQHQYELPAQYTITITDVTREYNQRLLDSYTAQKVAAADAQVEVLLGGITDRRAMMNAMYALCVCVNPLGNFSANDITGAKGQIQTFLGLMAQVNTLFTQRDADIAAYKASLGL